MKKSKYAYLKDDFIKLYTEDKLSLRKIAEKYGVDRSVVKNLIKDEIQIRPKSTFNDLKKDKAKLMYKQGYLINDISKKLDVNFTTLRRFLGKEFNIPVEGILSEFLPDLINDYKQGLSLKEIGEKYNSSPQTIHYYLTCSGEINLRNYDEAGREYELNTEYFNFLTKKKAYQLGLLLSLCRFYIRDTKYITRIACSKENEKLLTQSLNGITERNINDFNYISFYDGKKEYIRIDILSKSFFGKLKKICDGDELIPISYQKEFLKGFFINSLKKKGEVFYISVYEPNTNLIIEIIKNIYNITDKNIKIICKKDKNNLLILKDVNIIL